MDGPHSDRARQRSQRDEPRSKGKHSVHARVNTDPRARTPKPRPRSACTSGFGRQSAQRCDRWAGGRKRGTGVLRAGGWAGRRAGGHLAGKDGRMRQWRRAATHHRILRVRRLGRRFAVRHGLVLRLKFQPAAWPTANIQPPAHQLVQQPYGTGPARVLHPAVQPAAHQAGLRPHHGRTKVGPSMAVPSPLARNPPFP